MISDTMQERMPASSDSLSGKGILERLHHGHIVRHLVACKNRDALRVIACTIAVQGGYHVRKASARELAQVRITRDMDVSSNGKGKLIAYRAARSQLEIVYMLLRRIAEISVFVIGRVIVTIRRDFILCRNCDIY